MITSNQIGVILSSVLISFLSQAETASQLSQAKCPEAFEKLIVCNVDQDAPGDKLAKNFKASMLICKMKKFDQYQLIITNLGESPSDPVEVKYTQSTGAENYTVDDSEIMLTISKNKAVNPKSSGPNGSLFLTYKENGKSYPTVSAKLNCL